MDGGFYRGTHTEQDIRFPDKEKKLLKQMKFEDVLEKKVDSAKVNIDVIKPWITGKLNTILGMEDDVVIEYVFTQLEEKSLNPKVMQINLTGFLNARRSREFMGELWQLLLEAQESPDGIPETLINRKMAELKAQNPALGDIPMAQATENDWKNRYQSLTGGRYGKTEPDYNSRPSGFSRDLPSDRARRPARERTPEYYGRREEKDQPDRRPRSDRPDSDRDRRRGERDRHERRDRSRSRERVRDRSAERSERRRDEEERPRRRSPRRFTEDKVDRKEKSAEKEKESKKAAEDSADGSPRPKRSRHDSSGSEPRKERKSKKHKKEKKKKHKRDRHDEHSD